MSYHTPPPNNNANANTNANTTKNNNPYPQQRTTITTNKAPKYVGFLDGGDRRRARYSTPCQWSSETTTSTSTTMPVKNTKSSSSSGPWMAARENEYNRYVAQTQQPPQLRPVPLPPPPPQSSFAEQELQTKLSLLQSELQQKDDQLFELSASLAAVEAESTHQISAANTESQQRLRLRDDELSRYKMELSATKAALAEQKRRNVEMMSTKELKSPENSSVWRAAAAAEETTVAKTKPMNGENSILNERKEAETTVMVTPLSFTTDKCKTTTPSKTVATQTVNTDSEHEPPNETTLSLPTSDSPKRKRHSIDSSSIAEYLLSEYRSDKRFRSGDANDDDAILQSILLKHLRNDDTVRSSLMQLTKEVIRLFVSSRPNDTNTRTNLVRILYRLLLWSREARCLIRSWYLRISPPTVCHSRLKGIPHRTPQPIGGDPIPNDDDDDDDDDSRIIESSLTKTECDQTNLARRFTSQLSDCLFAAVEPDAFEVLILLGWEEGTEFWDVWCQHLLLSKPHNHPSSSSSSRQQPPRDIVSMLERQDLTLPIKIGIVKLLHRIMSNSIRIQSKLQRRIVSVLMKDLDALWDHHPPSLEPSSRLCREILQCITTCCFRTSSDSVKILKPLVVILVKGLLGQCSTVPNKNCGMMGAIMKVFRWILGYCQERNCQMVEILGDQKEVVCACCHVVLRKGGEDGGMTGVAKLLLEEIQFEEEEMEKKESGVSDG